MEVKYICSVCKQEFTDEKACKLHEIEHTHELHRCSICDGEGWYTGSDGVDTRFCSRCNGTGKVIRETRVQVVERAPV